MDTKLQLDLIAHREKKRDAVLKERASYQKSLRVRKGKVNKPYTDHQKVLALHAYALSGSWIVAAKESGINYASLRNMGQLQWFKDSVAEIRREEDDILDGDMSEIIKEGVNQLKDRVKNGDWMWNSKENKFIRKTLNAGTLHKITTGFMDQRNVARGKPTSISQSVSVNDRLQKLATEFENFQKGRTIEAPVNEIIDIEEPPYGDEEELSQGIRGVSGSTEADSQPGRAEQGAFDRSESGESIEG